MIKAKDIEAFLLRCSIEEAKNGGTFCQANGGGFGLADPAAIEDRLKKAGAVWARCTIKETGWGDKIRVSCIFRESPQEIEAVIRDLKKNRTQSYYTAKWEDGTVSIRREAEIITGEQRWKRNEGIIQLVHAPAKPYYNQNSWYDLRDPSNTMGYQTHNPENPNRWFNRATPEQWKNFLPKDILEKIEW